MTDFKSTFEHMKRNVPLIFLFAFSPFWFISFNDIRKSSKCFWSLLHFWFFFSIPIGSATKDHNSSKIKWSNRLASIFKIINLQCIIMRLEIIETNSMKTKLSANNNFAIFISGNICYSDQFRFINNISNNN